MKICPLPEGVYLPEGHLILRAKSQELRAIFKKQIIKILTVKNHCNPDEKPL
jgi:hypothetical protein